METEVTELVGERASSLGLSDSTARMLKHYWDGICQNKNKRLGEDEHFNVILGVREQQYSRKLC